LRTNLLFGVLLIDWIRMSVYTLSLERSRGVRVNVKVAVAIVPCLDMGRKNRSSHANEKV